MKLAIKGHATRGKEVIQLLEMLGADRLGYKDTFVGFYYYIECDVIVSSDECPIDAIVYTLEEFEEKFPYKVGDKVYNIIHNENQTITDLAWDSKENEVVYQTNNNEYVFVNYLQPYKEETMKEKIQTINLECGVFADKVGVMMGNYEVEVKDGITFFIKKQPQYPKTYEECFNICFGNKHHIVQVVGLDDLGNNEELFESFIKLKICRDAYWKIAGEQMGLSKPWESDFTNNDEERYGIYTLANKVEKDFCGVGDVNMILVFPTEEMRDAFFENFKDLIESCKELL